MEKGSGSVRRSSFIWATSTAGLSRVLWQFLRGVMVFHRGEVTLSTPRVGGSPNMVNRFRSRTSGSPPSHAAPIASTVWDCARAAPSRARQMPCHGYPHVRPPRLRLTGELLR